MHWSDGLKGEEARKNRKIYGLNVLEEKRKNGVFRLFLRQFQSPLMLALLIAAAATLILGEKTDGGFILVAIAINAGLGLVQEYKAEKSLEALKGVLAAKVEAYREGKRVVMAAEELVPGDILFVSNEHVAGADGVLIEADGLLIKEAMLTGESVPVQKKAKEGLTEKGLTEETLRLLRKNFEDMEDGVKVFMGTEIEAGVGRVLVLRTGRETAIGKVAKLVEETEEETPMQKTLKQLSLRLAGAAVGLVGVMFIVGWWRGMAIEELVPVAVALAVAVIPEGLAVSFTVVLVVGMQRVLKHKALVRRLAAAETLGDVDVICTDKTGTLTEGVMKVVGYITNLKETNIKAETEMIRLQAVLCNDMRDPLEIAMNDWALVGLSGRREDWEEKYPRSGGVPFTGKKRYIATVHKLKKEHLLIVSGAPEVILGYCEVSKKEKEAWLALFKKKASEGLRLVGFGYKMQPGGEFNEAGVKGLKWLGIIVFADPIREGVDKALEKVMEAGIGVKVITGDYKETALAIAKKLGLATEEIQVVEGEAVQKMGVKGLMKIIDGIVVFARTSPAQKLMIVEALKSKGYRVAMTGDGVNDAPALKKADIGIVVATATEVAKETAELVLLENDFKAILYAIAEGRQVIKVMRSVMFYLLSHSLAMVVLMAGAILAGWPLPLLAAQILFINLVVDGLPNAALILQQGEAGLKMLNDGNRKGLIDRQVMVLATIAAVTVGFLSLLTQIMWQEVGSEELSRSMVFGTVALASLVMLWPGMDIDKGRHIKEALRSKWLMMGMIWGVAMLTAAYGIRGLREMLQLTEIGWQGGVWVATAGAIAAVTTEGIKQLMRRE